MHYSISILHTLQILVRQFGPCEHFNGVVTQREAFAASQDGQHRAYTLKGDPNRKIWLNGEHVASVISW